MSAERLDGAGEDRHPRLEHGVRLVPLVERHGAVVGVDRGLDRVADVVDLAGLHGPHRLCGALVTASSVACVERRRLGVGVVRRRRVAVEDPLHPAVDDGGVGVAVERQPRRDPLHAVARRAVVEDARVVGHRVGEEEVDLAVLHGIREALDGVELHAARAGVGVVDLPGALRVRVVELLLVAADDGVLRRALAEVDARLVLAERALVPICDSMKRRAAVGLTGVALGGDDAVAVGVDGVVVEPVALPVGHAVQVELAGGDDGVAATCRRSGSGRRRARRRTGSSPCSPRAA